MPAINRSRSRLGLFAIELAVAAAIGLVPLFVSPSATHAQATRTWVSGLGDDANPCSLTAPCKTFAGAISKTAGGGEIDVLDPGGFGAVTITKSITIDGTGTFASILASGTTAIIINATQFDIVVIRGLSLQGAGATFGTHGINVIQAKEVHVTDTVIENFTNTGINFHPSASAAELIVTNTSIRNTGFSGGTTNAGIFADTTAASTVTVTIDGSTFESTNVGVSARNNVRATIRDSLATNNSVAGIMVAPAAGTSVANLESVVVTFNGAGIQAGGAGGSGLIRISNVTVVDNSSGLVIQPGSSIQSFINNQIGGNGSGNGPPSGTIPRQ
jgi:hypothetical protein